MVIHKYKGGMDKQDLLELFNRLDDKTIIFLIYRNLFDQSNVYIAAHRKKTLKTVRKSFRDADQFIQNERHDELIAALQELFSGGF